MKIDLVMMSKLGDGDGGRETWLNNFLNEILKRDLNIDFRLITLVEKENTVITIDKRKIISEHLQCESDYTKLPIVFSFIFFLISNLLFKKRKKADFLLAVGGLNEMLACLIPYFFKGVKRKKIIWLRTIYTKEKGYALNKFFQKIILKIEVFLINNFFQIAIANGEDTAEFYRAHGVKCHVIKNSIDLSRWYNDDIPTEKKFLDICFIGRLSEVKGILAFLSAVEKIKNGNVVTNMRFHVVGAGPEDKKVKLLHNSGFLHYYGELPNNQIPNFMRKMDVSVALTYLTESLGGGGVSNALIEQMASKQILVCWDNNIFRKVLDESSCYFVDQGNVSHLVQVFELINANIVKARTKSHRAYKLSSEYSIQKHLDDFYNLIAD